MNTTTATTATEAAGTASTVTLVIVYAVVLLAFYLFFIRPKSKKQKQEEALRASIEIGDEITTIGGISGRIVAIREDDNAFILETGSDRTKIKVKKWSVSTVDTQKDLPPVEKKGLFAKKEKKEKAE